MLGCFLNTKINMRLNERLVGCKNKYVAGCEAAECEAKFKNESVWSEYEAECVADCEAEWEAEI